MLVLDIGGADDKDFVGDGVLVCIEKTIELENDVALGSGRHGRDTGCAGSKAGWEDKSLARSQTC